MGGIDLRIARENRYDRWNEARMRRWRSRFEANEWSEIDEEPDKEHVTEIYNDSDLYLAAKNGSLDNFKSVLDRVAAEEASSYDGTLWRLSPAGNTFLHVAAKHGNEDIVTFIAAKIPSLVLYKNLNGETALHLAAKAGDVSMVKTLVIIHQNLLALGDLPEDENEWYGNVINLLRTKNNRGNTALHEALSNGWNSIAEDLVKEDPELSYYRNKDGESALYLAAKPGFANCVSLILQLSTDEERIDELFRKKSPIQVAIEWKRREVLEAMLNIKPRLIQMRDGEGRTPLHYAASLGYLEEVRFLLSKYPHNVTQRDKSGSFLIHLASMNGHVDVISFLLQDFPDPGELLDREGRNVLHIAAMNGRSNVVSFLLKNPDLNDFINMKDIRGNTPLHLATKNWHPKIVNVLTWDKRVDVKVFNDKRMTALDVAEDGTSDNPRFTERLTLAALKAAATPQFQSSKIAGRKRMSSNPDSYKERVNTLLLVSTLVATVTFAAGFTVPGGYNSSESDKNIGKATLLREKGFHIFVFCDIIAMYSSITVAVVLIWAQLGDLALVLTAITLAVPLLGIALGMMSMAFTAGVLIVVSKLRWLASAVLIMGITFIIVLLLLLLPLCTSLTSKNRVLRYLSYYPFCLLILASGS